MIESGSNQRADNPLSACSWKDGRPYGRNPANSTPTGLTFHPVLSNLTHSAVECQCGTTVSSARETSACASYGLELRSALPVARSTGHETCSWMTSHFPLIFL